MNTTTRTTLACTALTILLCACGETATLPVSAGTGTAPQLPPPNKTLIPTLKIAEAKGWPEGQKPTVPSGTTVTALASGLDHPRWLHVLPNGDVLVAESNAPERPDQGKGIKAWFKARAMKKAGAATKSANRITLLRDADGDGIAETKNVFLSGLNSPFGMALVGNDLYIANTDAVVRVPYETGATSISATPTQVVDLPGGPLNHHWTKALIASPDGSKLYATVGSNSNVAENGMDKEEGRAAIWEIDPKAGTKRLFATGLRNPNGMAWEPSTKTLWTVVNERDEIGSDLVPDYMTSVKDGGFYGWPYSYFGQHVDERVEPPQPELVAKAIVPDYALGSHTASLGLAWSQGANLPAQFAQGMFIGMHGSWNRKPVSGYKVAFVPFANGKPTGAQPLDLMIGFLSGDEKIAYGRPVGVAVDTRGGVLVADDVGNVIWRVSAPPMASFAPTASAPASAPAPAASR
jgi:glucose/arabinose dehydrogenase